MFFDKFLPICKNFNQQKDVLLTKKGYINCSFLQIIHYFVIFSRFLLTKRFLWCIIITVLNNIDYLHSFCCLLSFVLHIFIFSFLSYPDSASGHFFWWVTLDPNHGITLLKLFYLSTQAVYKYKVGDGAHDVPYAR